MSETFYVAIKNGQLVVESITGIEHVVKSRAELDQRIRDDSTSAGRDPSKAVVMLSSSLDFPHEFTNDEAVLALVREVRG